MSKETEGIEREIEQARDQLASSLDELAERANPKRIAEQAKGDVVKAINSQVVKVGAATVAGVAVALVVIGTVVSRRKKKRQKAAFAALADYRERFLSA